MFRMLATVLVSMLIIYITGCGDDEVEVGIQEDVAAKFLYARPPIGSPIGPNTSIFLVFDNMPTDVTSSVGNVRVITSSIGIVRIDDISEAKIQITGPFGLGPLELTVTWADGTVKLFYTVTAPCVGEDTRENTGCD